MQVDGTDRTVTAAAQPVPTTDWDEAERDRREHPWTRPSSRRSSSSHRRSRKSRTSTSSDSDAVELAAHSSIGRLRALTNEIAHAAPF